MEALEFLKERQRMCNGCNGCVGCSLSESHCIISRTTSDEDFKKMINAVEQWSKEHPRKTRQSMFLDQFPETVLDEHGVIMLCPLMISSAHRNSCGEYKILYKTCENCRHEFWMQEVE